MPLQEAAHTSDDMALSTVNHTQHPWVYVALQVQESTSISADTRRAISVPSQISTGRGSTDPAQSREKPVRTEHSGGACQSVAGTCQFLLHLHLDSPGVGNAVSPLHLASFSLLSCHNWLPLNRLKRCSVGQPISSSHPA